MATQTTGQRAPAYLAAYTPESIANAVLNVGTKRSPEYRLGLVAALARKLRGEHVHCPFKEGTTAFDAFFSGVERGYLVYRDYRDDHLGAVSSPFFRDL